MNIREYKNSDKQAVISLWNECGLLAPQNDPAKDIERKLKVDADLFLVGVDDSDEIIASIMGGYDGHRGWINYLAVSPSQQRKGYGERMMVAIEVLLKKKRVSKNQFASAGYQ